MAKIRIVGDASGYVEISAPNAAGNNTLELPSGSTKLVGADSTGNVVVSGILTATSIAGVTTAGITTAYIGAINDGPLSGARNRIINGDCRIDQRNSGASVTGSQSYPVDRWLIEYSGSGSIAGIQTSDVPTGQGFTNAIKFTSTARTTLGTNDFYQSTYFIEGYNISDFDYGNSSAKTVTLSFWVKASRTGTYQVNLANGGASGGSRTHTKTYTVSVADTWQKVILTYPGCTTGTWNTTNGQGIGIRFGFEYGSYYTTSAVADTWTTTSSFVNSFVSTTNTFTTNSNSTWFITGVQLEAGTVATPFERRSYGQELDLCRRYCQNYYPSTQEWVYVEGSQAAGKWWFASLSPQMRANPTASFTGTWTGGSIVGLTGTISGIALEPNGSSQSRATFRVTMSTTGGSAGQVFHTDAWQGSSSRYVTLSSEL